MKKILQILFMALAFTAGAETMYFWIENEDIASKNLVAGEDGNYLNVFITNQDTGEKTKLDTVVAEGGGYWKYNNETKQYDFVTVPLDPSDFGHKSDATVNNEYRYVYAATGSYSIDDGTPPDWSFTIEAITANGDVYGTSIAESMIWDKDDRWMWPYKDHICNPVHLDYMGTIPEPNSFLLILIGCGCLALRRKTII